MKDAGISVGSLFIASLESGVSEDYRLVYNMVQMISFSEKNFWYT
jgi:NAD(P)H-dependent flavin oxidoreductase YrpB (nitropropane dioxygenase family)